MLGILGSNRLQVLTNPASTSIALACLYLFLTSLLLSFLNSLTKNLPMLLNKDLLTTSGLVFKFLGFFGTSLEELNILTIRT